MCLALCLGLTVADLDFLTIGALNDIAITRLEAMQEGPRAATQQDFDAF